MTASIVIDIVLAVIILIFLIRHAIRGFFKSIIALLRAIVAPVLAILLCKPLGELIALAFDGVGKDIFVGILENTANGDGTYSLFRITDSVPDFIFSFALNGVEDDNVYVKYFVNHEIASEAQYQEFVNVLGHGFAVVVGVIIAFVVIFLVAQILFTILNSGFKKLAKKKGVKTANVLLGMLVGILVGAVIALGASILMEEIFVLAGAEYPEIFDPAILENTYLAKFFIQTIWYPIKEMIF